MDKLNNIHPGEILNEEFLIPLKISAYKLSKDLEIPQTRISQIIKGKRRITADTALRLSSYFGNSAKFWLGLQDDFDIEEENSTHQQSLKKFVLSEIKSQHNNLSDFNKMKNKNLTSCSSLLDLQYGKPGTKSRKKYEDSFEVFKKNVLLQELRKGGRK